MPTVDFTLDDLKAIFATKEDFGIFSATADAQIDGVKDDVGVLISQFNEMQQNLNENNTLILRVKNMLEEDFRAESRRVDRIDRRLAKIELRLDRHIVENTQ